MIFTYRSDFSKDLSTFIHQHKFLCLLTLGMAAVVYSIGNLAGRSVCWIINCLGTAKKTDDIGQERISSANLFSVNSYVFSTSSMKAKNHVNVSVGTIPLSFKTFLKKELEEKIFNFYLEHEMTFDKAKIHGRMHVARAVIFCEVMAKYYRDKKKEVVDLDHVRYAIALHDAGRKGNGIDKWEVESATLLYQYFLSKNISEKESKEKSNIIVKKEANKDSIEFKIFQSGDCLDIMRPCTGNGGKEGFKQNFLTFLKDSTEPNDIQFRHRLIEEAWLFIQMTEKEKDQTAFEKNPGFMDNMLQMIQKNSSQFPILASIL